MLGISGCELHNPFRSTSPRATGNKVSRTRIDFSRSRAAQLWNALRFTIYSYHSKRSIEYEYEYRDAEYEYEKTHEQSIGPKCSIGAL